LPQGCDGSIGQTEAFAVIWPSFRWLQSVLAGLAVAGGAAGFFLKMVASADDAEPISAATYAACIAKDPGETCSTRLASDRISYGRCARVGGAGPLVCDATELDHLPGAAEACSAKKAFDTCTIAISTMQIVGACVQGPGSSLVCASLRR
jgi:hypothetical protein